MQTSGKRSITFRPASDRTTRVAGLGLRTSLWFFAVTTVVSCSPGSLPDGFVDGGPGGGGTGGTGGGVAVTAATPVANCSKFGTLGEADAWFQMRCGINSGCHGSTAVWTDMQALAPLWSKLPDRKPIIACLGGNTKLVDKADWMKSFLIVKTSQMVPACPSGMNAGTVMPPPAAMQPAGVMAAPLMPDEVACIAQFAQAAAGK